MNEVEKMNEAMYERLGEIAKFASNKRVELDPDFKGNKSDETHNRLMLAAFTELRQMCEFYKPEGKEVRVGSSSSRKDGSTPLTHSHSDLELPTGCPSLLPRQLPGGFDGVGPAEKDVHGLHGLHGLPSDPNPCESVKSVDNAEELKERGAKIKSCNERSRERMADIALLSNMCLLNTNHPNGYEPGQYGQDYRTFGKAFCEIRKQVRESVGDVGVDYEMLALQFARNSFDFAKFQEALAAVASMKAEDFPGVYYTPGWLCELAKKLEAGDVHGLHGLHGLPSDPNPCESVKSVDEQREEARQKRTIHWTCYPTKVDLCVMGKTEQNGKVYEVRISKRQVAKIDDTYAQCKVNGKGVMTCNFTGSAWMLLRILTAGMQALVNYKAKRARDRRRNFAKRKAAAKAAAKEVK